VDNAPALEHLPIGQGYTHPPAISLILLLMSGAKKVNAHTPFLLLRWEIIKVGG